MARSHRFYALLALLLLAAACCDARGEPLARSRARQTALPGLWPRGRRRCKNRMIRCAAIGMRAAPFGRWLLRPRNRSLNRACGSGSDSAALFGAAAAD
jgi:hypothetical protein